MTLEAFADLIKQIKIPVAYGAFEKVQDLPFVVYRRDGRDDFFADNTHYHEIQNISVELCFEVVDQVLEKNIEKVFLENEIPFELAYEEYIESEQMYVIRWNLQI